MNFNPEKITAIVCLSVILAITAIFMPDESQIWGSVLGLLSLVLGGGSALKSFLRIP
jgi:hypothetical protein